jgi:hypothetical protein
MSIPVSAAEFDPASIEHEHVVPVETSERHIDHEGLQDANRLALFRAAGQALHG